MMDHRRELENKKRIAKTQRHQTVSLEAKIITEDATKTSEIIHQNSNDRHPAPDKAALEIESHQKAINRFIKQDFETTQFLTPEVLQMMKTSSLKSGRKLLEPLQGVRSDIRKSKLLLSIPSSDAFSGLNNETEAQINTDVKDSPGSFQAPTPRNMSLIMADRASLHVPSCHSLASSYRSESVISTSVTIERAGISTPALDSAEDEDAGLTKEVLESANVFRSHIYFVMSSIYMVTWYILVSLNF
jgi:hypothetical protein